MRGEESLLSASPAPAIVKARARKAGLRFWMERVLEECDRASAGFAPDPVHDLRVALRRCRSIADGFIAIDPEPGWREMKKAGRLLFSRLGELRDVHVMQEWVGKLAAPSDPSAVALVQFLGAREIELKQEAAIALNEFDRKQWRRWSTKLPCRTTRLRQGSMIFKHLALERWVRAYDLHRRAMRGRSRIALHKLRIGIKRFRYIVENFLPEQHAAWGGDLKRVQDLLGEVHDLDVLWATATQIHAFPDEESRRRWQQTIADERNSRIQAYRDKTLGKNSLWHVWRSALPQGRQVSSVALVRLKLWASLLDPNFEHSQRITQLALQLYDGLVSAPGISVQATEQRAILEIAGLLHDVGRSQSERGHHKISYRLIRRLAPPLGSSAENLHLAAIVVRYHRGVLPNARQTIWNALPLPERRWMLRLIGILRLANAFDADHQRRVRHLMVTSRNGFLSIAADNYSSRSRVAEAVAAERHVLELVCRRPILIRPFKARKKARNSKLETRASLPSRATLA
jgi:CHAD domain-containing protein